MPRFNQGLIKHPHVIASWTTIRLDRNGQKVILQVETDLALHVMDPSHHEAAVNDLLETVRAYMEAHSVIDSAEINRVADA
ncbi:MAG: hypothetical protein ACLPX7_12880 [Xanthobacteraceae bacterium]